MNKKPIKMREILLAVCFVGMMICTILGTVLQLVLPEGSCINLIINIIFHVDVPFVVVGFAILIFP